MKKIFVVLITCIVFVNISYGQWTHSSEGIFSEKINQLYPDGGRLYACTGNFGLYFSSSSGANWYPLNNGIQDKNVNSIIRTGTKLIIATNSFGIYTSTDNGENWTLSNSGLTNLSVKCLAVLGTNIIAGTDGAGVFISTNNGNNWTSISNGLNNQEVKSFFIDGTNIYAGTGNGISLSTNNGSSWTTLNNGIPGYTIISSILKEGSNLYASTYTGIGVFKSTNSGQNWTQCNNGLPLSYHINNLAVRGSYVFAATGDGVYSTSNSGLNWLRTDAGIYYPEATYIASYGTDVFAGTLIGLFKSADNGANWESSNIGFASDLIVPALFNSGNDIYAGTRGNGVFKSTDSGTSWYPINKGIFGFDIEALAVKGTKIIAATDNGIYITSNYGTSWIKSYERKLFYSLAVKDSCIFAGICSCSGGGVLLSTDDGLSWNFVNNGISNNNILALAVSAEKVFCGTNDGLYMTTNSGGVWSAIKQGLPAFEGVTSLATEGTKMILGTFESGVFISTDTGSSWNALIGGLPSALRINSVSFSGNSYIASTPLGVYVRNANSGSWLPANTGFQTPDINSIRIIGNTIFAGSGLMMSSGVWKRPLGQIVTGINHISADIPKRAKLYNIFPNPFNPVVEIRYDISVQGNVKISIFDITGRTLGILVNGYKSAGSYTENYNAINLSSGIYFVRLETGEYTVAKRMMLIK